MLPQLKAATTRTSDVQPGLDRYLLLFCQYALPLMILLFSGAALLSDERVYHSDGGKTLPFHVLEAGTPDDAPSAMREALAGAPQVSFKDTSRSEMPFWFLFRVGSAAESDRIIEFPSRHAQEVSCWNAASLAQLGQADRRVATGSMQGVKGGFALSLVDGAAPHEILCKASYSGPARITVATWSETELDRSTLDFHHATGIIEGGLLSLSALVFMASLINREPRYALFAVWLIGNLRLGGITMGFDTQWLGHVIPPDWMPFIRQTTIATYYVVTFALLGQLFKRELRQVGWPWLLGAGTKAGLILLLLALVLDFATFLPAMWIIVTFGVFVIVTLLGRIVLLTRSRVALWYALALGVVLFCGLSEVIAAAFQFKAIIGSFNSVTAALGSSLIAAFAFAEQIRIEREDRKYAEAELERTYEVTPIGLFTLECGGQFLRGNPALLAILGVAQDALNEQHWDDYFDRGSLQTLRSIAEYGGEAEMPEKHREGHERRWYLVKAIHADTLIEGSLQDITERRQATEKLKFLANNDSLTGTLNRRGIEQELGARMNNDGPLSLAYLDLDRFKLINDFYGHQAGDEILKQVCERIETALHPNHKLGRVGGDEFLLVMDATAFEHAEALCRTIIQEICSRPFQLQRRSFQVKISIGLIEVPSRIDVQDAISAADRACREAKKGKLKHLVAYTRNDPAFAEYAAERKLIRDLGCDAFSSADLTLLMQPIMSVQAPDESLNFEVLIRMRDSSGGYVPAGKVISAAESNGTIGELDKWVLSTTLAWLGENHARLPNTQFVCVNLSGASMNDETFIEDTFRILSQYQPMVKYLCLEITESVALHDIQNSRRFIERLKGFGAKVALDDFGAGYTSFSYLKEFPADALKIDGSFVRSLLQHPANFAIIEAIIELARNLGMRSIAEWVEDADTYEALAELGVDYIQGYVVSRPVTPDVILAATSAASFVSDEDLASVLRARSTQEAWPDEVGSSPGLPH